MCGNPFKSNTPKVEKVDPVPQAVDTTDTTAADNRVAADAEKQRKKRGYAATRVAEDRGVLTDTATGDKRTTLG